MPGKITIYKELKESFGTLSVVNVSLSSTKVSESFREARAHMILEVGTDANSLDDYEVMNLFFKGSSGDLGRILFKTNEVLVSPSVCSA